MKSYRPIYDREKKKKEEKPESMIALIGVLGGAFAGAYLWLIILGGIL